MPIYNPSYVEKEEILIENLIKGIEFGESTELIKGVEFFDIDEDNLICGIYYDPWGDVDCLNIIPGMYEVNKDTGEFRNKDTKAILAQYDHYSKRCGPIPYKGVHLRTMDGKLRTHLSHRVILSNFVPFRRTDQNQVNHKDSIKNHNYLDNLEWSSPRENTNHMIASGNWKRAKQKCYRTFTDEEVKNICELLEKGESYKNILSIIGKEDTPINRDYVGRIKQRNTYKHISKDFNW